MKHKGLIALAAIFAAGIVLTTFTSRMLGVEKPVENTVMTNAAAAPIREMTARQTREKHPMSV